MKRTKKEPVHGTMNLSGLGDVTGSSQCNHGRGDSNPEEGDLVQPTRSGRKTYREESANWPPCLVQ